MVVRLALAALMAVSAFSLDASAQRRGRGYGGYGGITVYEHPDFRGDSVTFRNEVADLREHGLNDRISSLELDGNQAWEVCRDAHFSGGCRVFSGTIDDLRAAGWNDRISSMRAVGFARNNNRGGWWGNGNGTRERQQGTERYGTRLRQRLRQQSPVQAGVLRSPELPRRRARHLQQRDQSRIGRRSRTQRASLRRHVGTV